MKEQGRGFLNRFQRIIWCQKPQQCHHPENAAEPRVSATAIQTVGRKGYDGFALALVTADQ